MLGERVNQVGGNVGVVAGSEEQDLKLLVEQGEWEMVIKSKVFAKRNLESQAQMVSEAIDSRLAKMRVQFGRLINKGSRFRSGAMGLSQRMGELESVRDEIVREVYEQHPRSIADIAGVEIDFY